MMRDVRDMIAWARSRIDYCRAAEIKFGQYTGGQPPQTLIEAWTERRALQAVLEQLEVAERTPGRNL